ncbi:MAG: ABC transporter substrate-binding protein [Eubacteriales bacterium]|nr:ABC transporter substrate-binding protein [Eubacteriales bacterium]
MKKNILAAVMSIALAASMLAGCGSSNTTSTSAAETKAEESAKADTTTDDKSAKDLKEVNVVLDWYPNALHTFIYTAIEKGYYEEEGLKVNIQFPSNANDALSIVAAGKAEIGLYYQHDIIQAVANQGIKVKSIGAVVQSPLNIILSLKDKNITRPKDLEGKTVGYAGTALSEALVKTMMEADGADFSSVNMMDVGFELMSSMTTGNVDATIGCLVNHEVPQLEEEGFDVNYFMVNEYGIPNYYEAVFLANDELIESDPEMLKGFLRASKKGFEDFKADPDGCLAILLNNQNEENFPLSETVEQKSSATILPLMENDDASFLSQSDDCWQENIDWMLESGLIDKAVEVDDVRTNIEF